LDCSSEGIVGDFVPARAVTFELVAGQGFTTCIERDFVVWGTDVAEGFCSSCFVVTEVISLLSFSLTAPKVFGVGEVIFLRDCEGGNV